VWRRDREVVDAIVSVTCRSDVSASAYQAPVSTSMVRAHRRGDVVIVAL
jgi:hypothetical protein